MKNKEDKITFSAGISYGISKKAKLPHNLKEFLLLDDQGIEGFEFMLQDPYLNRQIPSNVRIEYEQVYYELSNALDESIQLQEEQIQQIKDNPKETIHALIGRILLHDD